VTEHAEKGNPHPEMQTMPAECPGMERGVSSDRAHLNAIRYKAVKEAGRLMEIERQLPELENEGLIPKYDFDLDAA
jgi:hypothetical protein